MATKIVKLFIVIVIVVFYTITFALCKASSDAERRYEKLVAEKFDTPGGDVNAI